MKRYSFTLLTLLTGAFISGVTAADRAEPGLAEGYRWQGRGNWCIDGGAVASSIEIPAPGEDVFNFIDLFVPEGSTIEQAFLYSVTHFPFQANPAYERTPVDAERPVVELQGKRYEGAVWDLVGRPYIVPTLRTFNEISTASTYRTDATEQIREIITEGGEEFRLSLKEVDSIDNPRSNNGFLTSGEVLVVIYSNEKEAERLIILNDGYAFEEQDFTIDFKTPIDTSVPGFEALLSLGIAHSFQSSRLPLEKNDITYIDVDGRRLTSAAGGNDDAIHPEFVGTNGTTRLITVGGLGNNKDNPRNPLSPPVAFGRDLDDELYNLNKGNESDATPYLTNGATSTTLTISQPLTRLDPLFLVAMNIVLSPAPAAEEVPVPPVVSSSDEPDVPRVLAYDELYSFTGHGNWSIDAVGKANAWDVPRPEDDALRAVVPAGSTIEKAFLYSVITNDTSSPRRPAIYLHGHTIMGSAWTELKPKFNPQGSIIGPRAFRADITNFVRHVVGSESGVFEFPMQEIALPRGERIHAGIEGEALVVVYSNPAEPMRSILLLDGASTHRILETVEIRTGKPLALGRDFEALMSVGIGGSWQNAERTGDAIEMMIDDRFLTKSAGGADDAGALPTPAHRPGKLITMGGLDDISRNPLPESAHLGNPSTDDELYDLSRGNSENSEPFLTDGTSRFRIQPRNSSIGSTPFFVGLNFTTDAGLTLSNSALK